MITKEIAQKVIDVVSPALRTLKITLNDSQWSSNAARTNGLKRLSVLQLGTDTGFNEMEFTKRVAEMVIRKIVPIALRKAAEIHPNENHRIALLAAADRCEQEGTKDAARAAAAAADAATYAAAAAAARAAADAADAAKDEILQLFATEVENILIDMKVPGVQWLDLIK
jgi:hypothetical protein